MYGRNINFTLLAPSLWAVVEAIASNIEEEKYKRMLFKTGDNSGFIIEVFENISVAGKKIETVVITNPNLINLLQEKELAEYKEYFSEKYLNY